MRVLKWIVDRVHGRAEGKESPIGWTPHFEDMEWNGLDFPKEKFLELQRVDRAAWKREVIGHEELFILLHSFLPNTRRLVCRWNRFRSIGKRLPEDSSKPMK
jgi:phosphoenolpyruvate carboxykinase (GTP)